MNEFIEDQIRAEITRALTECPQGLPLEGLHAVVYSSNSKVETIKVAKLMTDEGSIIRGGEIGELYLLASSEGNAMSKTSNAQKKPTNRDRIVDACKIKPLDYIEIAAQTGLKAEYVSVEVRALCKQERLQEKGKNDANKKTYLAADSDSTSSPTHEKQASNEAEKKEATSPVTIVAGSNVIAQNLRDNAIRAQDSMDEYIASVCDQEVLAPLRAQRDAARQAYYNYCKQNGIEVNL